MNPRGRSAAIGIAMLATAAVAHILTPREQFAADKVALESMVPRQFGNWAEEASSIIQVAADLDRSTGAEAELPAYDQILMRTYRRRADGEQIMLALAYGRQQRQEFKIHRPELCYYGQGYEVRSVGARVIALAPSRHVASQTLMARNRWRLEPVTYWIRIGDQISDNAWQTRWIIFREGMAGRVPDGILVRASSLIEQDSQREHALNVQRLFLSDLYAAMSPRARRIVAGV
jgi:EpsI family protein